MATRIAARDYVPLPVHREYALELGCTPEGYEAALLDLRDKLGTKLHDPPWLDAKLCSFIEQAAQNQDRPRRSAETPAERRTREQLDRVKRLEAEEMGAPR